MKTTPAQFKKFKARCEFWRRRFGINDWEITYQHRPLEERKLAEFCANLEQRQAVISLSTDSGDDGDREILSAAKHEMIHLLLAPFTELAEYRFVRHDELYQAEHAVLMRLMELL